MESSLFDKEPKIYISKTDFVNGIVCPYTWYLRKVKRVKGIISDSMIKGTNLHSLMKEINSLKEESKIKECVEQLTKQNSKFKVEIDNILRFLTDRRNKGLKVLPEYSEFRAEVRLGKFVLQGIIDAVYVDDERIEVFEYKNSFYKPDEDLFDEVGFYSFLFSRVKGKKVNVMGIFSFMTGEVKYRNFVENEIYTKITSFLSVVEEGNFYAIPSEKNCSFCVFRNNCEFSYIK